MAKELVAAIVPAFNEAAHVAGVLSVLVSCPDIGEVVLVDDGSTDETPVIGRRMGVKVVSLAKNGGKGNAMKQGIAATAAPVVIFFDADLIGLNHSHVEDLLQPIRTNTAVMSVGVKHRLWNIASWLAKIDPLFAIGGERAMRRELLGKIPEAWIGGFMVETGLNYYCARNKLPITYVALPGLQAVIKEKKWGWVKGFISRVGMVLEILHIRIRIWLKKLP